METCGWCCVAIGAAAGIVCSAVCTGLQGEGEGESDTEGDYSYTHVCT